MASAIRREGIRYPVAQDNKLATWSAWGNQYWPADYLVDREGRIRLVHYGEGDEDNIEAAVRTLLADCLDHQMEELLKSLDRWLYGVGEYLSFGMMSPNAILGLIRSLGAVAPATLTTVELVLRALLEA